jgi:hypothetical protein
MRKRGAQKHAFTGLEPRGGHAVASTNNIGTSCTMHKNTRRDFDEGFAASSHIHPDTPGSTSREIEGWGRWRLGYPITHQ